MMVFVVGRECVCFTGLLPPDAGAFQSVRGLRMEVRRAYELLVLSRPSLSDEDRQALLAAIRKTIEEAGGEVFHTDTMGKRMLAYPVEKEREGYYDLFYFAAYPSQLAPIERWLKLNTHVLRYMMVRINRAHFEYIRKKAEITLPEGVSLARPK